MNRIVWAASAAEDLRDIIDWLVDRGSGDAARTLLSRVEGRIGRLQQFPESGRVVPELLRSNITRYREVVIDSWRVIYRHDPADAVLVLAVIDARRNIEDVLLRRGIR